MATGTVKWFDDAKGFGFITQSDGGDLTKGPKGLQAANVRPVA